MLRRQYAQDLMNNKKFIFGKYTILAGAKVPIFVLERSACSLFIAHCCSRP